VPSFVRTGVGNFFGNLGDVWSLVNGALQGDGEAFGDSMGRVMVNTFIGIGGVFDVATEARIPRHREDFGQTLAVWGVPSGPYLVLPFLGSSTVRDTAALPVDWKGNLWSHVNDIPWRNSGSALFIVDTRSRFLEAGDLINDAALDPYTFKRDFYLQKRNSDIHNGDLPDSGERYDLPEDEQPAKP
jgi:phospholipid-binding lipoprotein MlaA